MTRVDRVYFVSRPMSVHPELIVRNDDRVGFLYFGRLDDGKGIFEIIQVRKRLTAELKEWRNDYLNKCRLFIFGAGKYEEEVKGLTTYDNTVHFFGRKPISFIDKYIINVDYVLLPSTVIETFGRSFAEGVAWGKPVIGFRKGGQEAFIDPHYDLTVAPGKTNADKLYDMVVSCIKAKKITPATEVTDALTHDSWFEKFADMYLKDTDQEATPAEERTPGRVLLVSDYKAHVGGVESYMYDAEGILIGRGLKVDLFGWDLPQGTRSGWLRSLGLVATLLNVVAAVQLALQIRRQKPDLIWFQNSLRFLWWLPIWVARKMAPDVTMWMMRHDMGYFVPYASRLSDLADLPKKFTREAFAGSAPTRNPLTLLLMFLKYCNLRMLRRVISHEIDRHLVPSDFIKKPVHDLYDIPTKRISTFPHFIHR